MDKRKILEQLKKEYEEYMNEFESSEFMDVDEHIKWSLKVGVLLGEISVLLRENEWLYGKLNQIDDIIQKGRKESDGL